MGYYYPVKDHKAKLKFPKFKMPSLPSFPSLHLPQAYGKDGGLTSVKTMGMAAATGLLVAGGLFLSLPIIGLGVGRRSLNTIWESEYFNREHERPGRFRPQHHRNLRTETVISTADFQFCFSCFFFFLGYLLIRSFFTLPSP